MFIILKIFQGFIGYGQGQNIDEINQLQIIINIMAVKELLSVKNGKDLHRFVNGH